MGKKGYSKISSIGGFSLMPVILITMIITAMITAGVILIGPMAKRAKNVESQKSIDGIADAIVGWSVTNNRVPDSTTGSTGFTTVIGDPKDAWHKPFIYIVADNMLNPSPYGICHRRTTNLRVTPVSDDIAFVVISGGEDNTVNSTPNTSQALNGTVIVASNDIVRWITLEDLKMKAGCYGTTRGRLKILNNELPEACIGQPYTATLFSDGGVLPYGSWTSSTLPAGLVFDSINGRISGTPTGPAQIYNMTFSITDSDNASAQRILPLNIKSCGAAPTCTLSANPAEIIKRNFSTLNWSIVNGPANASFSPSSGACGVFLNTTGGNCRTDRLTAGVKTDFILTVTNTNGSNNCSVSVYTGYRVWNDTAGRFDFMVDGRCVNVNKNNEITDEPMLLSFGESIYQYNTSNGTCGGGVVAQLNYAQAVAADIDNDSRVEFSGANR